MAERPNLISTTEAAARLGVTPPTIRAWINNGTITGHRVGRNFKVDSNRIDTLTSAMHEPQVA